MTLTDIKGEKDGAGKNGEEGKRTKRGGRKTVAGKREKNVSD